MSERSGKSIYQFNGVSWENRLKADDILLQRRVLKIIALTLLIVASIVTALLLLTLSYHSQGLSSYGSPPQNSTIAKIAFDYRYDLCISTVVVWLLVAAFGSWVWKGRTRIAWKETGFDKDVFDLLMKMKGGNSRLKVMHALVSKSKDRLQLSNELQMDWKTIDRHIKIHNEYGLVKEQTSYGNNVKFYMLTEKGSSISELVEKLSEN